MCISTNCNSSNTLFSQHSENRSKHLPAAKALLGRLDIHCGSGAKPWACRKTQTAPTRPLKAGLNSVYTRSGQNSTPNSNATNLHSSQKRCCSFCISSSNASPTFQVQKSIFHQMTKPIQVTVILPLLLAISFSRNDDIHSSISGISNDLIGVIPTIGQ